MRNILNNFGSTKVWVPTRSSEFATILRHEKLVQASLLLGFITMFIVLGLDVQYMLDKLPLLVVTIPLVLVISFCATVLACLLGLIAALSRLSNSPIYYVPAKLYVSLFQGIPLIVLLFILYFGLPHLNPVLLLTPIQAGIIGLALSNGAFLTEVFRSSVLSVPEGQSEAARAIGMSNHQRMWRIILPQAARIALPPTANYYIFILKDSALVGFIGVAELFSTAQSIGQRDFKILEMLLLAGAVYWIITIVLSSIQMRLEQRMETAYSRET